MSGSIDDELAHAGLDRLRERLLQLLEEEAPLQRAGRGVVLERIGELLVERAAVALLRGDAQAHRRLAVELGASTARSRAARRAVAEQRIRAQRVIRPLALQARDQRALDRGVRLGVEGIHQRRADDRVGIREAVQLEPRRIRVDDDAFLHVRDRIGRAGHERLAADRDTRAPS